MPENICPNCENDISDVILSVAVKRQRGLEENRETITCPHCGTELAIAVSVRATIARAQA